MASKAIDKMNFSAQSSGSSSSSYENDEEADQQRFQAKRIQTAAIMYDFFEDATEADSELSYQEKIQMRETINDSIREDLNDVIPEQVNCTSHVVLLLRKHGEEFDKRLKEDNELQQLSREAITEDTDSSQPMFVRIGDHLKRVIELMFETDEDGKRIITPGRICAVFMYCYRMSKDLLKTKGIIANWLVDLATCLVVNFAKAKFYEWLEDRGGWLKVVVDAIPSNPISRALLGPPDKIPNNLYLVGGVVLIGIWAYNRYIRKV